MAADKMCRGFRAEEKPRGGEEGAEPNCHSALRPSGSLDPLEPPAPTVAPTGSHTQFTLLVPHNKSLTGLCRVNITSYS